ncbi:MAG: hypothetical protein ACO2PP_20950 [Thermocrinis sp.]|jgi:hypothetical protein|uniref:hypothetical protein n=1 Tax=Thermocrinis sp. TaxID=2024383 RepID=UPI003BFC2A0D
MQKPLTSVLLLGAQSPLTVCFPNKYCKHYYFFHIGEAATEEEVRSAITSADVIYSFLSEEEADVLSWALRIKVPKRNLIRLEEAFNTLGVEEPQKIYLVVVHWEMCPIISRVWISFTGGGG